MAKDEKQEAKVEEPKELVPLTHEAQEVKKWFERMKMYPVPLPNPVKYMAARMAVAYGLDPFLGEMIFIPQYKGGDLVGYQPYVGIGGVRRAARRTGEYNGRELRPCTDEEREALGIHKDAHAWLCKVWRKGIDRPFDGFGIFPMRDNDKSKAPPWRMARKRAEHAALRAAFDLELQLMEGNGMVVEEKPFDIKEYERTPSIEAEVTEVEEGLASDLKTQSAKTLPVVDEAIAAIEEALGEDKEPEEPIEELDLKEAITTGHAEGLWAYAEAKGIDIGIVKTVLEETGGEVEETLARLKEKYGEVDDA